MKQIWRDILKKYNLENPKETRLNKVSFSLLLKCLVKRLELTNKKNIQTAFKTTGIISLNPDEVLKRIPNRRTDEYIDKSFSETLIIYLKEIQAPAAGPSKERKRKKC